VNFWGINIAPALRESAAPLAVKGEGSFLCANNIFLSEKIVNIDTNINNL
jgi:hypothetical protein